MDYKQALARISQGKKVRLPEWTGYWFKDIAVKPEAPILALTRTGDIVPAWAGNEAEVHVTHRIDWEEVTEGLGFDFAILALKAGKKVCREGWNGKGAWLYLVPGSTFQVAEGRPLAAHLPIGETVKYHSHIDMKTTSNEHVPWLASQTDMLATDWQIADIPAQAQ